MKSFEAKKYGHGEWLVTITDVRVCFSESDVYKLIRQEGMEVKDAIKTSVSKKRGLEITEIRGE